MNSSMIEVLSAIRVKPSGNLATIADGEENENQGREHPDDDDDEENDGKGRKLLLIYTPRKMHFCFILSKPFLNVPFYHTLTIHPLSPLSCPLLITISMHSLNTPHLPSPPPDNPPLPSPSPILSP